MEDEQTEKVKAELAEILGINETESEKPSISRRF